MDLVFQKGSDLVVIRIVGKTLYFSKVQGQWVKYADFKGLKFSIGGILQEFPDLKDKTNDEILQEGKKRFMNHIQSMETEREIIDYLREDLKKHGYALRYEIKKGFRPKVIRDGLT